MRNDENAAISSAISHLLAGPLTEAEALHLVKPGEPEDEKLPGLHSHETWELFCPLQGDLHFVAAGQPPITVPACHLLLVPPNCLHLGVGVVEQPEDLSLLVINLPCEYSLYGGLTVDHDGQRSSIVLSAEELKEWTTIAGVAPERLVEQAVEALGTGYWGRERALGLLRIMLAAFAEVSSRQKQDRLTLSIRRVAEARLFLVSHYHDPNVTVESVAAAVGFSTSHLQTVFKKVTGYTPHQLLIDLRMRRAKDLLTNTNLSVKEIAAMTGWTSQLYFSAAYHRRHGHAPSVARMTNDKKKSA